MPVKTKLRPGDRIHHLTYVGLAEGHAINRPGHQRLLHEFMCDCGTSVFTPPMYVTSKHGRRSCGCRAWKSTRQGLGDLSRSYFSEVLANARQRGLVFAISLQDAYDCFTGKCALSGVDIELNYKPRLQTASLDRIDSAGGYVAGNIQWVHQVINRMKMDLSEEEFRTWCRRVAEC